MVQGSKWLPTAFKRVIKKKEKRSKTCQHTLPTSSWRQIVWLRESRFHTHAGVRERALVFIEQSEEQGERARD